MKRGDNTRTPLATYSILLQVILVLSELCFSEHRATPIEYGAPALTIDHRPSAKPFVQLDVELVVGGNQCDVLCQVWW